MTLDRRDFLKHGLLFVPGAALLPALLARNVFAAPGTAARNLVLVELFGGNDGFNTVVPYAVNGGVYYSLYRPTVGVAESSLLKLGAAPVGFHPALAELKQQYDLGRLAVIQGVSYPNPDFSHEVSQRIWHTGDPGGLATDGWLARYLNLFPEPPFPCAAELLYRLTGLVDQVQGFVPSMVSLDHFRFPIDGWHWDDGQNRKNAYARLAAAHELAGGTLGAMSKTALALLDLIATVETIPEVSFTGAYPEHWFADGLKLALRLMNAGLGMRIFHLGLDGFDTHDSQNQNGYHAGLLATLSKGLAAFQTDLAALGLANDTLVVVFSEFGRTVYENGGGGTDHGTVNPVFVLGNAVQGGLVTPHPSLDPADLTWLREPPMVADFRDVFGTVLLKWFGESAPVVGQVFPGHAVTDLGFLP